MDSQEKTNEKQAQEKPLLVPAQKGKRGHKTQTLNSPKLKKTSGIKGRPKGRKTNFFGEGLWKISPSGNITAEVYTPEVCQMLAENFAEWLQASEDNVFICDWCEYAKIPYDMPDRLADKSESFNAVYKTWQRKQKHKFCKGGMTEKYNAGFTKFMLACNHGMRDTSQVQVVGANGDPLTVLLGMVDNQSRGVIPDKLPEIEKVE